MNTLENSCFQFQENNEASQECIRIMNKNHRSDFEGRDKYFYWIANNIADTFYKMDKNLTVIPSSDYLALLTGKQLTEGERDFRNGTCRNCRPEECTNNCYPTQESVKQEEYQKKLKAKRNYLSFEINSQTRLMLNNDIENIQSAISRLQSLRQQEVQNVIDGYNASTSNATSIMLGEAGAKARNGNEYFTQTFEQKGGEKK